MKIGLGEVMRDFDRGYTAGTSIGFVAGLAVAGVVALIVAAAWWLL